MARTSVAGLWQFVKGFESEIFWIGIDVHKRSYHLALLRADGRTATWVGPPEPDALVSLIRDLGIKVGAVAQESGPTGFGLARALMAAEIPAIVAAPSKIPREVRPGAKCDRLDCTKLAAYAAKGMLKTVAIPTPEEEARRALVRRRHMVVDGIRRCKQRIKGQLLFLGLPEPRELANWSQGAAGSLLALQMADESRFVLESHLRELDFLQKELREVKGRLQQMAAQDESRRTMACLQSVPGVGPAVAATFCHELFRPERFDRAEEVASYLGLAPVVRHSGEKSPRGRIAPVGQKRLRSLLIEAAWTWRSKDAHALEVYNRIFASSGLAQKAITALARRLAIILWRLAVEQRMYRPGSSSAA
jgi:transposase